MVARFDGAAQLETRRWRTQRFAMGSENRLCWLLMTGAGSMRMPLLSEGRTAGLAGQDCRGSRARVLREFRCLWPTLVEKMSASMSYFV